MSQDSIASIVTGYGLDDAELNSGQWQQIFLFSKTSTRVLGPTKSPTERVFEVLF